MRGNRWSALTAGSLMVAPSLPVTDSDDPQALRRPSSENGNRSCTGASPAWIEHSRGKKAGDVVGVVGPHAARRRGRAPVLDRTSRRYQVDAVSGCIMLVKRSVFEQIGLLDED